MAEQNYKNHRRVSPVHHLFLLPLILLLIAGSTRNFFQVYNNGEDLYNASLILAASIILLIMAMLSRSFALKAQDRAIRAEENLRYFAITGKLMDNKLTIGQVIALRFAPNNELMDLAHEAVEKGLSPDEIKKSIKNWREDTYRI